MRKWTIRQGIFETNSSSMHSIAVVRRYEPPTEKERREVVAPYLLNDGTINLADYMPRHYGTNGRILDTFIDKLCYVVASLFNGNELDLEDYPKYTSLIKAIGVPEVTGLKLAPNTEHYYCSGPYEIAGIDHQSVGMVEEVLPYYPTYRVEDRELWEDALRRILYDPSCHILIQADWADPSDYYDILGRM